MASGSGSPRGAICGERLRSIAMRLSAASPKACLRQSRARLPRPGFSRLTREGLPLSPSVSDQYSWRRYSATELIARIAADPDSVAPSEFATFQKLDGTSGAMSVGDAYVVRMAGPWDGPVRVATRERDIFRLVTLDGHLEAGQIEFRARDERSSWCSRSRAGHGARIGSPTFYMTACGSARRSSYMWTSTLSGPPASRVDAWWTESRSTHARSTWTARALTPRRPRRPALQISFRSVARSPEGLRARVASLADLKPNLPDDLQPLRATRGT